ncbi:phage tail protein [Serratia sp. OLHL2]|uniref:phage head closure protein n=1 Tax=unclassified Serratia (in: enterobacteria) TaxID=2647522 RepID=UPI000C191B96|nr:MULTISPECIES: phage head closure protein [unclassified Serratia (in: enterobacteria)]PII49341.1 phage tail protein [Serratia sp. OLCL1]PII49757.1 phage tail protein [Serratia sp. OLEL1]PII53181.1 phage tail protein [Serratia sp. OLBL1]PII65375.1 phage tail protein [Serratia sp. OLHL2]PII73680.1 phage tail protein [Serratia sp. OLJL1]
MKIRQAQTSASYLLPDPGELDKRIVIRRRVDEPTDSFGLAPTFPESFRAWAKMAQVGAATYQASVQTETTVTHYFTLRYRSGITTDHEVVLSGQVYRVRRVRDLNSKGRFLLLECEELGSETRRSERHGGESVFTR